MRAPEILLKLPTLNKKKLQFCANINDIIIYNIPSKCYSFIRANTLIHHNIFHRHFRGVWAKCRGKFRYTYQSWFTFVFRLNRRFQISIKVYFFYFLLAYNKLFFVSTQLIKMSSIFFIRNVLWLMCFVLNYYPHVQ